MENNLSVEKSLGENDVMIFACMNKDFVEGVQKLASEKGVKLVATDEQVIRDYIADNNQVDENARMTAFLSDARNRQLAFSHAKEIWRILGNDKALSDAKNCVFNLKSLVSSTSLSWNKAEEILNTLEAFGFVKRNGKFEFSMNFDKKDIRDYIYSQVVLSVESLNYDLQRYKGAIQNSNDLSEDEKNEKILTTKEDIVKQIAF